MQEAPEDSNLCWRELALIAKALADGCDVTEIGLMRGIALRTIAMLGGGSASAQKAKGVTGP